MVKNVVTLMAKNIVTLMARNVVTLYVDDTGIRLLVCKGNRVKRWAELPLQPGQIEGAVITEEAEVANKLKQLLKEQKIKAKRVVVGLSGLHCLTRPIILPQLPKAMLAEAVIREARRLLPVPPEQLYISWQTLPAPEGKTHVFLVAISRRSVDALLKMLHHANLKPYIMGVKPLALASLVKEATAIIVDVQPTEFDIVVLVDGIPQPIRTMPFPSQALSGEEKLSIIVSDLDRTIEFYNSNSQDEPLNLSVPMYVSGEIAREPELCQSLSDRLGYTVSILKSPLEVNKWFTPNNYLVNIGLVLQEPSLRKMAGPVVAKSNLLPAEYQPKPISWVKVVALPSAIAIAGLVVPLVMFISDTSANIVSTSKQLNLATQVLSEKQSQKRELVKNIAELEGRIVEVEASLEAFNLVLNNLDAQCNDVNGNLDITMDNLPNVIELTSIQCTGNNVTIVGRSPSETGVLLYARNLNSSGRFSQTNIVNIKRIESGGMTFSLVLTK